jgi:hypothetical protein
MRNIRENLFFAFIYNTLGIPLAAGVLFYPLFGVGWLSPIIAGVAMRPEFRFRHSERALRTPQHQSYEDESNAAMKARRILVNTTCRLRNIMA